MTREEMIRRWAENIIPAVFKAEHKLHDKLLEYRDKCKADPSKGDVYLKEYCTLIATEIVSKTTDEELESYD